MKTILCYGDSNTWGFMPFQERPPVKALNRFPRGVRWPSLLEAALGEDYHVVEEGLNGRTTMFDCLMEENRNGLKGIDMCLLTHLPLDLVILMLGTNDTKEYFHNAPYAIARGMQRLIGRIRGGNFGYGPGGADPEVLVVAPPRMNEGILQSWLFGEFDQGSLARDAALGEEYRRVAEANGVHFLNAGASVSADPADGVHLSAEGHRILAELMEKAVREILEG